MKFLQAQNILSHDKDENRFIDLCIFFVVSLFTYFMFLQIGILTFFDFFSEFRRLAFFIFIMLVTTISAITFYLNMHAIFNFRNIEF